MNNYANRRFQLGLAVVWLSAWSVFMPSLQAQTSFIGPANGDWFTAANWSAGLPAPGNDANIPGSASPSIGSPLTVNFNITSFGTITNNSALTVAAGTVVSGGAFNNTGSVTVNAGQTFKSSGALNNTGAITNNGTLTANAPVTNAAAATLTNTASFTLLANLTNAGSIVNSGGTFDCTQTITNSGAFDNQSGATLKLENGSGFVNSATFTFKNEGTVTSSATFTNNGAIVNTGTFQNLFILNNAGTFNNNAGGQFQNTSTVNNSGTFNNNTGGTLATSFRFFNTGTTNNYATLNNGDTIDNQAGGTFCNQAGATLNSLFGSFILNEGTFQNKTSSTIVSNGEIDNNSGTFSNDGVVNSSDGSKIINSAAFSNTGNVVNINTLTNNATGSITNSGSFSNNSGGVLTNKGTILNNKPGLISNYYNIVNQAGATATNNGSFINVIRYDNFGTTTNNGYFNNVGDFTNEAGSNLNNSEVFELNGGTLVNKGSMTNSKTFLVDACSALSNYGSINNTGVFTSGGIIFQRGTITGNAIAQKGGFVQTSPTSDAPICRTGLSVGTDANGAAKLYAQATIIAGIDTCFNFQYFANGVSGRTIFDCSKVGTNQNVHMLLTTRTGDSLTCNTTVAVFDAVPPVLSNCPPDVTVLTGSASGAAYSWGTLTALDNCDLNPTLTSTSVSGQNFPLGVTKVTVTAKDKSANTSVCLFNVSVVQTTPSGVCVAGSKTPPAFSNCPSSVTVNSPSGSQAVDWIEPTVTSACLPVVLTRTNAPGTIFGFGATTVTYTATDANKNTSVCSFTITVTTPDPCVTDQTPPVVNNCPTNVFLITNPIINGAVGIWTPPTATDNCGAASLTGNFARGAIFPVGATKVTYTATDAKGNKSVCNFNVTVAGSDPCPAAQTPVFSNCPANFTVNTSTNSATVNFTAPTASDPCGGITINSNYSPGAILPIGPTVITYVASDAKGNKAACSFTATVANPCYIDSIKPIISGCPSNIIVSAGTGNTGTATWTPPTVTDNCGTPQFLSNYTPGSAFPVGTTNVFYRATDARGNQALCTFTVTVNANACSNDKTPPVISGCPANVTVTAATGATTATATWTAPTATDNCSLQSLTGSVQPGASFNIGTTTVTYTAKDVAGNTATCTFTVTVNANVCSNDKTPPVIANCPANVTLTAAAGTTSATATWTAPTATDNCSAPTLTASAQPGSTFNIGTTTVTYTAKDAAGNTSTCSFTVTVQAGQGGGNCGHITAIYQVVDTKSSCGTGTPYTMYINGTFYSATGDVTFTQYDNGVAVVNGTLTNNGQKVRINLYLTGGTASAPSGSPKLEMCTSKAAANWFYYPNWSGVIDFGGGVRYHPARRGPSFQTGTGANLQEAVFGGSGWFTGEADGDFNFDFGPQLPCNKICPAPAPTGGIVQETWNNVPGSWLSDLDGVAAYPNTPDARATLTELRMPQNYIANTADRVRGFVYPPVTGNYTFYTYGDDNTLLFVSPDKQPAGKIRVCAVIGWTNEYEITKYPTQQSFQMWLNAGQPYYLELQHKQGGGGNNFGAMWLKPGDWQPSVINGKYLSPYTECGASTPPVCATQGGLYHEIWQNQYSWASPIVMPSTICDQHDIIKTFDGPINIADNYESRAKGYIVPTVSGAYSFNETGDDFVELYLSSDENPANKKMIAYHYGWTNVGEFNKYATQNSATVNLQAGKYYYVELRHKEGGGGDFFSVNWTSPDNGSIHPIPSSCLFYPCNSNIGSLEAKSQLLTLKAYKDFRAAHLEWLNNTGARNDYFAVERLNNETGNFEAVGSQKAYFEGSDVRTFTAADQNPQDGDNFYRVKLTFRDGSVKYSEARQVVFGKLSDVGVFPNPTDGQINIDLKAFEGKEVEIYLYNQMGFEIKHVKTTASGAPHVLETDELVNGHYQVRIRTAGKRDVVKQVILLK